MFSDDTALVAAHCKHVLPLHQAALGEEFGYPCIAHCVIDSVYSIGVRYEGVRNVIRRYDAFLAQQNIDVSQHTVQEMLHLLKPYSIEECANQVFMNRQRTSARNGILKAEAVLLFANVLHKHGIAHKGQTSNLLERPDFESDIRGIPGQGSGISLKYFFMLSGEMNYSPYAAYHLTDVILPVVGNHRLKSRWLSVLRTQRLSRPQDAWRNAHQTGVFNTRQSRLRKMSELHQA